MDWLKQATEVYQSDADKINAFGYILYTDANPHTKKILRDPDYWQALDELSGDNWVIFAIQPDSGPPVSTPQFQKKSSLGTEIMVQIPKTPPANRELLELFGLESTGQLPLLVLYVLDGDKFLSVSLKINDDSVEEGFNSLKKAVETSRRALDQVDEKHWKENAGVFGSLEMQIGHHKNNERLKKVVKFIKDSGIAPLILGL